MRRSPFSARSLMTALLASAGAWSSMATPALAQETLRWAHVYQESTPFHQCALQAAEVVEEETEGRYTIEVFPASSLGKEEALNEGLTLGTVDIIYTGPAFMAQSSPNIAISDYPFVFRDFDHWAAFWDSDLLDELAQEYTNATGNILVASNYYGTRHVTSNKPILKPEDMEGLKIRVPNAPAYTLFPESVGANPTPMALSEVYLGLQQGAVDAQENPLPTIKSAQFHEVQSDLNLTGHTIATLTTLMSGSTAASLSEEDREIIFSALRDAADHCTEIVRGQEDELVAWFEEQGMAVHEVDRQPFIEAVRPSLTSAEMPWEPEVYERLQAIGQ